VHGKERSPFLCARDQSNWEKKGKVEGLNCGEKRDQNSKSGEWAKNAPNKAAVAREKDEACAEASPKEKRSNEGSSEERIGAKERRAGTDSRRNNKEKHWKISGP